MCCKTCRFYRDRERTRFVFLITSRMYFCRFLLSREGIFQDIRCAESTSSMQINGGRYFSSSVVYSFSLPLVFPFCSDPHVVLHPSPFSFLRGRREQTLGSILNDCFRQTRTVRSLAFRHASQNSVTMESLLFFTTPHPSLFISVPFPRETKLLYKKF